MPLVIASLVLPGFECSTHAFVSWRGPAVRPSALPEDIRVEVSTTGSRLRRRLSSTVYAWEVKYLCVGLVDQSFFPIQARTECPTWLPYEA